MIFIVAHNFPFCHIVRQDNNDPVASFMRMDFRSQGGYTHFEVASHFKSVSPVLQIVTWMSAYPTGNRVWTSGDAEASRAGGRFEYSLGEAPSPPLLGRISVRHLSASCFETLSSRFLPAILFATSLLE